MIAFSLEQVQRQPIEAAQGAIQSTLSTAQIPPRYAGWDLAHCNSPQVQDAVTVMSEFARAGHFNGQTTILLGGDPGVGKTTLALACLQEFISNWRGRKGGRFWSVAKGLTDIKASFNTPNPKGIPDLFPTGFIVLDDLGKERLTDWAREQVFYLLDEIWTRKTPCIITTNIHYDQFCTNLGDPALVSRIMGGCTVIKVQGQDLRQAG